MAGQRTVLYTLKRAETRAEKAGMEKSRDALATLRKEFERCAALDNPGSELYDKIKPRVLSTITIVNRERDDITARIESVEANFSHSKYRIDCFVRGNKDGSVTIATLPRTDYPDAISDLLNLLKRGIAVFYPAINRHIPIETVINKIHMTSREIRKILYELDSRLTDTMIDLVRTIKARSS